MAFTQNNLNIDFEPQHNQFEDKDNNIDMNFTTSDPDQQTSSLNNEFQSTESEKHNSDQTQISQYNQYEILQKKMRQNNGKIFNKESMKQKIQQRKRKLSEKKNSQIGKVDLAPEHMSDKLKQLNEEHEKRQKYDPQYIKTLPKEERKKINKEEQRMKNRISAQVSRDKKKVEFEHMTIKIQELENLVQQLTIENNKLQQRSQICSKCGNEVCFSQQMTQELPNVTSDFKEDFTNKSTLIKGQINIQQQYQVQSQLEDLTYSNNYHLYHNPNISGEDQFNQRQNTEINKDVNINNAQLNNVNIENSNDITDQFLNDSNNNNQTNSSFLENDLQTSNESQLQKDLQNTGETDFNNNYNYKQYRNIFDNSAQFSLEESDQSNQDENHRNEDEYIVQNSPRSPFQIKMFSFTFLCICILLIFVGNSSGNNEDGLSTYTTQFFENNLKIFLEQIQGKNLQDKELKVDSEFQDYLMQLNPETLNYNKLNAQDEFQQKIKKMNMEIDKELSGQKQQFLRRSNQSNSQCEVRSYLQKMFDYQDEQIDNDFTTQKETINEDEQRRIKNKMKRKQFQNQKNQDQQDNIILQEEKEEVDEKNTRYKQNNFKTKLIDKMQQLTQNPKNFLNELKEVILLPSIQKNEAQNSQNQIQNLQQDYAIKQTEQKNYKEYSIDQMNNKRYQFQEQENMEFQIQPNNNQNEINQKKKDFKIILNGEQIIQQKFLSQNQINHLIFKMTEKKQEQQIQQEIFNQQNLQVYNKKNNQNKYKQHHKHNKSSNEDDKKQNLISNQDITYDFENELIEFDLNEDSFSGSEQYNQDIINNNNKTQQQQILKDISSNQPNNNENNNNSYINYVYNSHIQQYQQYNLFQDRQLLEEFQQSYFSFTCSINDVQFWQFSNNNNQQNDIFKKNN